MALEQAEVSQSDERSWRFATKECLCQFLTSVGSYMDKSDKAKSLMDQYFKRISSLLDMANQTKQETNNKHFLPSRIRFMMEDLLDFRNNNWVAHKAGQRTNVDEPKPLSQLRKEVNVSEFGGKMSVSRPYHYKSDNHSNDVATKCHESPENIKTSYGSRSPQLFTNGTSQGAKYNNKAALPSVVEDDQDWRSNKVEGSWRKLGGNSAQRTKKITGSKTVGDDVWRRDGQYQLNNSNQLQNLPPRMMRQRQEGIDKLSKLDQISERSTSSPSPTSSGKNDYTRPNYTATSNMNEIFGLKKPKTLFEPDYLRENKTDRVYLGPVDKFQQAPIQTISNSAIKPSTASITANGKCNNSSINTDNGQTELVKHDSARVNKNEIANKILSWLESIEDTSSISETSLNTMIMSNIDNGTSKTVLDNSVYVDLLSLCCSATNDTIIEKCVTFIGKMKFSPETVISVIKPLLSTEHSSDLFINDDYFSSNLSKFLAHLVLNGQIRDLVSLAQCAETGVRNRMMIAVIRAIMDMDPTTDLSTTKKLLNRDDVSVNDIFQASDDELSTLLQQSNLIHLLPEIKYKVFLERIVVELDVLHPSFTDADSQHLLDTICDLVGSDKAALKYSVDWLIAHILPHVFDEVNSNKSTKDLIEEEKLFWRRVSPTIEHYLAIDPTELDQLNIIYTLQQSWNRYKQPKGALLRCFICFYDLELIDEAVFYLWKDDTNSKVIDKGKALFEVNKWLQWLKTAEYIKPE